MDTIFAPGTPVGGAIAIIRMSGPLSRGTLEGIFSGKIEHRYVAQGTLHEGETALDSAMAVYFAAPASYTGEDMAELYVHGGYAVVQSALALLANKGLRPAQPGEFTRRAFLNGKLDLAQAEAVQDLIFATARRGAASAMEQLSGKLSARVHAVESRLLDALSGVDAAIDYPEELEEDVFFALPGDLAAALQELRALAQEGLAARVLREGARVAIWGLPNAGKSSLLNALCGEERAIVTPKAGTTRDVIEAQCAIEGIAVRLLDTAGIRAAEDMAERIGVTRAWEAGRTADLILVALDAAKPPTPEDEALLQAESDGVPRIAVICKVDLQPGEAAFALAQRKGVQALGVSALFQKGMEELRHAIAARLAPAAGESALVTNARHVEALSQAAACVEGALAARDADCIATDLRAALLHLGEITGSSVDADVIERIFSRFCVGK
ncbi:MAG: tRNA uridine-5-carboxymethylaminomethyl(34) synthesis GTPase MnmE [Christensenellaceae bacterium]|jgi:tRNA modification GTPase|nr:tRNA uridine-5-carboxymethylaminomethyl(34) synthesis GTPase MnmE [Christensenellaceae bacterium]